LIYPLAHGQHVVHVGKGHFNVDLGKLRLPVRAKVLIPEASRHLHVTVEAREHEKLLILLGRLRQRIKLALVNPAGNQIIPRALRRRFGEDGRLDLAEALGAEIGPGGLERLVTQPDDTLKLRPAQVEIAVLLAQVLAYVDFVADSNGASRISRRHSAEGLRLHGAVGILGLTAPCPRARMRPLMPSTHSGRTAQARSNTPARFFIENALYDAGMSRSPQQQPA
jgi:hypothetical protein